jgi:hypothetical protein
MENNYKYLCAVKSGDKLFSATIDSAECSPGDFVILDSGLTGYVQRVVFVDVMSQDYAIFTDFVPVDEIVKVYHHWWSKSEESEDE